MRLRSALIVSLCALLVLGVQRIPGVGRFIVPRVSVSENPIAAARMPGGDATLPNPSWAEAGAGTIPARASICSTLGTGGGDINTSQSVTGADISSAISGCAAGETVLLNPGTYTITEEIYLKTEVTLRGSGADETKLNWTANSGGSGCGNQSGTVICANGPNADGSSGVTVVNWTAGFTQGTTQITVDSNTNLAVGKVIVLDADADGTTAASDTWPEIFECTTAGECAIGTGSAASGRGGNLKAETFLVEAVTGGGPYTITLSRPISAGWFVSASDRKAFWVNNSITTTSQVSYAGVENLWIDAAWSTTLPAIKFVFGHHNWAKGVKVSHDGTGSGNTVIVQAYYSSNITLRDSYIFGGGSIDTNDHYAFACRIGGNHLIENNVFQRVRTNVLHEQCQVMVIAYNYSLRVSESGGWIFAGIGDNHYNAGMHHLYEGNDGVMIKQENQNGNGQFLTAFRNHLDGVEQGGDQTVPLLLYAYNRFNNLLGNVLGTSGYHTKYKSEPPTDTDCIVSVLAFGFGGNCGNGDGVSTPLDDDHASASNFLWGNWDVVNSSNDTGTNDQTGTRWQSSEVPTAIGGNYQNTVPASQTLPSSLYLSAEPSFFGSVPWPAIGPDVSSGNVTSKGGHVYKIPARACADTIGAAWGDTTAQSFNAADCYPVP